MKVFEHRAKKDLYENGLRTPANNKQGYTLDRTKPADERDGLVSEIEEFLDELQSRLDNMPDQLQESSVLNERIEELDSLLSELN